ncbi:MAG TPA: enoyl-CoA hydratase/isomerase family protein [Thermoanaerobaculia bacterium]|jgi:enoyl-CoA hydratase/carnithine racemase|nr:enoyl-CoA hydratase/isomerase family protein [Thermoanaerobaculia bacterium]
MIQTFDHGPVRELRLDRPPANALSPELIAALRDAVEAAPGDGARALVISGSPRMFSGGLDVPLLVQLDRPAILAAWRDFYAMMRALATSTIPIAAAITGHSPAGGAVISLFCDARIMTEGDFRIGLNEVQVGLFLPPVIYRTMRRLVGSRQAERLCVGGLLVSSAEAARIGLVDELAPHEQVVERAVEWCRSLLALPPKAMTATRRLARADLAALFAGDDEEEILGVLDEWFSDETQRVMREVAERLTRKK